MKKILLSLVLLSNISLGQNDPKPLGYLEPGIFNSEWFLSLKEKINFITFTKSNNKKIIEFRIYRGDADTYKVNITNTVGNKTYTYNLKQEDQIDVSNLEGGVYLITAEDSNENKITKRITVI